jgi:hypothetical protein
MKNIPSGLLTFLQTTNVYGRADLFQITFTNGQLLRVTDCQVDMTLGGATYHASQFGSWSRGTVKSKASFSPVADDMTLTARVPPTVNFPGTTVPFMNVVTSALSIFDGAKVTVSTAYWAPGEYPNTTRGVETKFAGVILKRPRIGRSIVEFTVGDLIYLLNTKTPPHVIQSGCRHVLYDSNCTAVASSFTVNNSVAAGSTVQTINLATAVAASVYALGYVEFNSGQNTGIIIAIRTQPSTTQIVLAGKTPLPLGIGDLFTMTQGCDKTQTRCQQILGANWFLNYGGQDYVPNPEVAV